MLVILTEWSESLCHDLCFIYNTYVILICSTDLKSGTFFVTKFIHSLAIVYVSSSGFIVCVFIPYTLH